MECVNTINTMAFDNLIGGSAIPCLTKNITIAAGEGILKKGTVLAQVTASGKYRKANSANDDGSKLGSVILKEDVAALEEVVATVYIQGIFIKEALVFGGEDTATDHEAALRSVNIILTSKM